jgi:hypothetical protein
MWIPSYVVISGNEVADGLVRQAVESGTVHGKITIAYEHRILARQAMLNSGNMAGGQETVADFLIQSEVWSRSNHGLMDRRRRGVL